MKARHNGNSYSLDVSVVCLSANMFSDCFAEFYVFNVVSVIVFDLHVSSFFIKLLMFSFITLLCEVLFSPPIFFAPSSMYSVIALFV